MGDEDRIGVAERGRLAPDARVDDQHRAVALDTHAGVGVPGDARGPGGRGARGHGIVSILCSLGAGGVCYQCGALTARNRGRRASCIAGYPVSPAGQLFLRLLIAETGPVSGRLRVREIDDDEGRRLVRIIRRGSGSVVTWRRAQMVLLSAQGRRVVISEA